MAARTESKEGSVRSRALGQKCGQVHPDVPKVSRVDRVRKKSSDVGTWAGRSDTRTRPVEKRDVPRVTGYSSSARRVSAGRCTAATSTRPLVGQRHFDGLARDTKRATKVVRTTAIATATTVEDARRA